VSDLEDHEMEDNSLLDYTGPFSSEAPNTSCRNLIKRFAIAPSKDGAQATGNSSNALYFAERV